MKKKLAIAFATLMIVMITLSGCREKKAAVDQVPTYTLEDSKQFESTEETNTVETKVEQETEDTTENTELPETTASTETTESTVAIETTVESPVNSETSVPSTTDDGNWGDATPDD